MVRCNGTRRQQEIHAQHNDGNGEADHDQRIRSRSWQHICLMDQKKMYNQAMQDGCIELSIPFNINMWQRHHDANLSYSLARIKNAEQRREADRYCGWEPHDLPGCQCSWRTSTGVAVEPDPGHPLNGPRPNITREVDTKRQINAHLNDPRRCLQATATTYEGPVRFAWPDTIRPLTLASFGRDADPDWCLYKNPLRLVPISMGHKHMAFLR